MEYIRVKTEAVNGSATPLDPRTPRNYPVKSPHPIREAMRVQTYESRPKFTGLMVRPTFTNTLPDLPMDPKFVKSSLSLSRFVEYKASSLDMHCQYEVHFDPNIHAYLDLVIPPERNPAYMSAASLLGRDEGEILDASEIDINEKDVKLLEDEETAQKGTRLPLRRSNALKVPRAASHSKSVAWLRRTEYISTELTRFQPQFLTQDRIEAKIGFSLQKELKKSSGNNDDHRSRIRAIQKTFEDIRKPITKHFAKPGVVPVEIMEVFPDFEFWKYSFAMVSFDRDPSLPDNEVKVRDELASGAMIRGVTDESGDQFVAYFLPTEETAKKLRQERGRKEVSEENEKYEYELGREYDWNVKSRKDKEEMEIENLLFVMRDNKVYYNEIETRISLTRRRTQGTPYHKQVKSMLTVTNVPKTARDYAFERERERRLEPKLEGDYDEPEVPSDLEDGFNTTTGVKDGGGVATAHSTFPETSLEMEGFVEDPDVPGIQAELMEEQGNLKDGNYVEYGV